MKTLTMAQRAWLYKITLAVLALLAAYKLIDGIDLWQALAFAILAPAPATALRHLSPDDPKPEPPEVNYSPDSEDEL